MSKAEITRRNILQNAFELIYKNGYQATSIDDILSSTSVTKGAFFHHFKSKDEMGLALIREIMHPGMKEMLVKPLENDEDPTEAIYDMMKGLLINNSFFNVKYGCPAVNLIEEMAPLNKSFNNALSVIMAEWQDAIRKTIENGKARHKIRKEVSHQQVAWFVAAGYGGIRNMGKLYGESCYHSYLKELKQYLKTLK